MKRIILLSLLSLCHATLASVPPVFTDVERDLCEKALGDDVKATEFGDYIAANFIDIDTVIHTGGLSVGNYIGFELLKADKTTWSGVGGDRQKYDRIKHTILPKVAQYRSNQPETAALRNHLYAALGSDAGIAGLQAFLAVRTFNIDLIDLPANGSTIAQYLTLIIDNYAGGCSAGRAQKILDLPEIKKFRSNKEETAKAIFKAFEKDPIHLRDFEISLKKLEFDVDDILYDAFTTIGKKIDELVSKAGPKDVIHEMAKLVWPYRKIKMREFRNLLKDYEADTTKFEPLKKWFKESPFDVDGAMYGGSTLGSCVDALKKEMRGSVAELVLPYRAAKIKAFRDLLKDYEINSNKTDALKKLQEWFDENPCDIDAVLYDARQSSTETFGDKINAFKDAKLGMIFNAKRSKPNPAFNPPTLSGRSKALIVGVIATIAITLWYKYRSHHTKQDDADTETAAA